MFKLSLYSPSKLYIYGYLTPHHKAFMLVTLTTTFWFLGNHNNSRMANSNPMKNCEKKIKKKVALQREIWK